MLKHLVMAAGLVTIGFVDARAAELVETESPLSVAETVANFVEAAENAGATVFATVDHAEGARSVSTELPETTVIIFGNPKIGTPVIAAERRAGLDLPLRVLVWEEGGQTRIAYEDPEAVRERHDVEGADEAFRTMKGALDKLVSAATGG
ncbi:DUF302 domain-containing protein [Lutibaculum baratangense]|uniref:DUF302 domain-containing protein n=1 Tax=Lutibaculum baratangense AMV1 TaxID=631454 RepID=V4QY05_9HYPH|nr:DUF302 domain-containing protein [Lutibaculum baratangense]ESR24632.1 hypothetical protein N177_2312 [Lutibaculum baratangense AMV1]